MCDHNIDPQGDVILTLTNPNAPIPFCELELSFEVPSDGRVTFLVSSRHLVLASPVFKAMLTGGWSEGDKKDGQYSIQAEGWDVEALTIVMYVLHSQYNQVDRVVMLKRLGRIAVIVDYYKVHEAFRPMALLWTTSLRFQAPSNSFSPEDLLLILISWVFEDEATFQKTTKAAILWGKGMRIVRQGLPIPPPIIDRINQCRKESLDAIATGLYGLQQDYIEGREGCSFECSAIQLGALTKNMHDIGLIGHSRKTAFGRQVSVMEVVEKIESMESPTWHTRTPRSTLPAHLTRDEPAWDVHQCLPKARSGGNVNKFGVEITKKQTLADLPMHLSVGIKNKIEGLRLADFRSDNKKEEGGEVVASCHSTL